MNDNELSPLQRAIMEIEKNFLSSKSKILNFQSNNILEIKKKAQLPDSSSVIKEIIYFPESYEINKKSNGLIECGRLYDKSKLEETLRSFNNLISIQANILISLRMVCEDFGAFHERFLPLLKIDKSNLFIFLSLLINGESNDVFLFLDDHDFVLNITFLDDEYGKLHYNFTCNKPEIFEQYFPCYD